MVEHGKVKSNCFIINKKLAYISDVSKIYKKDYKFFKNLQYLIIDCLRFTKSLVHFCLDEALYIQSILKPKKTILTNLNCELDYDFLIHSLKKIEFCLLKN